ncbi:conserved hypothetical protein [Vibrio coralliirubri]|nr:hypothetical protein [Vibrio coralliirubri]CDT68447.1 conserved hypothetical protein [Vibrio coralliirubri]
MFQQGDLCPHCGLIIVMPTDLQGECLGCCEEINQDPADDYDEEE